MGFHELVCSGVFNVYMAHAPSGIEFSFWFVLYFIAIPVALIFWAWRYHAYLRKKQYKLKELAIYLLVVLFVTSIASFNLAHMYIYIHSPASTGTCFTGSCVISDRIIDYYHIPKDEIEEYGVPSFGLMKGYWVYDEISQVTPAIPVNVRAFVVVRTIPFMTFSEVTIYNIEKGHVTGKKTVYIVWPMQPGKRLSQETNLRFTVILAGVKSGPGL